MYNLKTVDGSRQLHKMECAKFPQGDIWPKESHKKINCCKLYSFSFTFKMFLLTMCLMGFFFFLNPFSTKEFLLLACCPSSNLLHRRSSDLKCLIESRPQKKSQDVASMRCPNWKLTVCCTDITVVSLALINNHAYRTKEQKYNQPALLPIKWF